jgi:hypothetical protein
MFPIRRAVLALAVAATLGACEDDPFAPDLAPQGEARFTYSGHQSGEFVGSGRLNRRNPNAGAWAVGEVQEVQGQAILGVFSQQRRADDKIDGLIIEWVGAQVGSVTCEPDAEECAFAAIFSVGTDRFTGGTEATYTRTSGTVTVTELTGDRARGTFNITLQRRSPEDEPPSIQANGSFDVPLNVTD